MAGERPYVVGNKPKRSNYQILVKRLTPNAKLPTKAYRNDAGWDLYAIEDIVLEPYKATMVSTGIAIQLPDNYFAKIFDRSGNASKKGFHVLAGVIDNDYTGEIKIVLLNYTNKPIHIKAGDKIAQMVVLKTYYTEIREVSEFIEDTERGNKGFGSSDKN